MMRQGATAAAAVIFGLFATSEAVACESGELSVSVERPLAFGRVSTAEGRGGAVVVPVRGEPVAVGDVIHDGRSETGLIMVCGEPQARIHLALPTSGFELAREGRALRHPVRDLELLATGAVVEKQSDDLWLVTLGTRGQAQVEVGGTLIIRETSERGDYSRSVGVNVKLAP